MNPPGPALIQTEFIDANNLRFEVLTAGSRNPAAPLALCLHGFPETADSWREQIPVLASLGFRVWAPNQRGYGQSSRPVGIPAYAIEHLMDDVAALIDAAGAPETVLLAHDWGALVAWTFATRRLRPLHRLVIINVPHPVCFSRALRRHPSQALASWYVAAFQLPWLPEWLLGRNHAALIGKMVLRSSTDPARFPRDLIAAFRNNAAEPGALTAMLNWYRAFLRGGGLRRQLRLGFPPITTPTLVLWGEEDVALTLHTLDGTADFATDLTLHRLPGVSHWVQQDSTAACNAALRAFLTPTRALTPYPEPHHPDRT